jgi:multiple sugar transport system substrate-binding protein
MKSKLSNLLSRVWLGLVLLSMVLSACAQPTGVVSPQTTGQASPRPGNDTPATPVPGGAEEDEHAVITFAGDEYLRATYEPLMAEFNKLYPNITVQFAQIPQYTEDKQDLFNNYQRLMATSGDTSITWIAGSVGNEQYFLDLLPLMEGDPTFDPGDFWDGALEACQDMEGRSLGIPTTLQVTGIFYNDEAFAEAGVPAPRPGWTWDDFREVVVAMTKVEEGRTRYGYAEQNYNMILTPLIEAELIASDGEINAEQMQAEFQWYLDLVKEGAIFPPPYAETEEGWNEIWQKWNELFTSPQRPAMWVGQLADQLPGAEWVNDESDPFANSAINIDGFAPFPVSADDPNQNTSFAYTQCLSISKGTRYPRAAWTWLNFLSQQWSGKGKIYAWDLLQIPARRSTIEANNYFDLLPEKAIPALEFALNHAWFAPGFYSMESGAVAGALYKTAAGFSDFTTALAEYQASITPTPEPTPDTEPVVVNTPLPTVSPDATLVKYFSNAWGEELETLNALVLQYSEDHPDIAIRISTQIDTPGDWYLAVTDQFDCFSWYNMDWTTQSPDNLLPLDSLIDAEGTEFKKDFNPNLFKSFTFEGTLYGLPIASDFMMMGYNKTLLEKKGLKIPNNDWSFEDFATMLEQVGGGEGSERTYGYQLDEWDESLFLGKGVRWADLTADPAVPMLNSPDMVTFLTWLIQLKESGGVFVQTQDNYMEFDEAMRAGRIAFYRSNASSPQGYYFYNEKPPFEMGVAPFPQFNDPTGMFFQGSTRAHMISRNSQNVQACWDWITFLSEQPVLLQGVPARASVLDSPAWEASVGVENAAAMRAAMNNLQPQLTSYEYNPIHWPLQSWRSEAVRKALAGEDINEVLNGAQQKAEVYLECMVGVDPDQFKEDYAKLDEKIRACGMQADPDGDMWQPMRGL